MAAAHIFKNPEEKIVIRRGEKVLDRVDAACLVRPTGESRASHERAGSRTHKDLEGGPLLKPHQELRKGDPTLLAVLPSPSKDERGQPTVSVVRLTASTTGGR